MMPRQLRFQFQLLFDACQENLAIAKGGIQRKDIKVKAEAIKKAMEIIVRLQAVLDLRKEVK